MNPVEWLKAIYETFGTSYPRVSLVVVMFLGAIAAGAIWIFAAKQVQKAATSPSPTQTTSGPATTSGDNSPAVTGNGNDIRYDHSSRAPTKSASSKKH